MPRLILALVTVVALGATLLLLRQQHLRLRAECHRLHAEMYQLEQELWRQQVQVAAATSPEKVERLAEEHATAARPVAGDGADDEWSSLAGNDVGEGW